MPETTRILVLRILLAVVCVSHLALGLGIMIGPPRLLELFAQAYGVAQVPTAAEFLYLLKPLGAYMITISFLSAAAFYAPVQNRIAVHAVILLLLVRTVQRFVFASDAIEAFGLTTNQLITQSVFFLALALALFLFRPRAASPSAAAE
jgi:hypothetical protein